MPRNTFVSLEFDTNGLYYNEKHFDNSHVSSGQFVSGVDFNVVNGINVFDLDYLFTKFPSCSIFQVLCCPDFPWDWTSNPVNYIGSGFLVYFDLDSLRSYFGFSSSIPSALPSLNGKGCEYMDGELVNVYSRSEKFSVIRSFFIMLSDNTYSPCYDLVSDDGLKTLTSPEGLMSAYVVPVENGG